MTGNSESGRDARESVPHGSAQTSAILFELDGTRYAIASQAVRQVEMLDRVTPVPNAPPWVEGIVFSRGAVIPAIDLRTRFGHARAPFSARTRLIVVEHGARVVGLIVDTAREFRIIPAEVVSQPEGVLPAAMAEAIAGVAHLDGQLVLMMSAAALLDGLTAGEELDHA